MKHKVSILPSQIGITWLQRRRFFNAAFAAKKFRIQPHSTRARSKQQLARASTGRIGIGPFRADWDSLAGYRVPAWFPRRQIWNFSPLGVYSVPAFGNEWYSRNIYVQGNAAFKHHVESYGPQSKFGYKDFIPMFRAEHFDANAWVDLFAQAGVRYVVPVAEHCDGFAMYDSALTDWDAAKMGPEARCGR